MIPDYDYRSKYMRLLVKGSPIEAKIAAARHGVPANYERETEHGETILLTSNLYEHNVTAWFNTYNKSPYPVGTLLWYRYE